MEEMLQLQPLTSAVRRTHAAVLCTEPENTSYVSLHLTRDLQLRCLFWAEDMAVRGSEHLDILPH